MEFEEFDIEFLSQKLSENPRSPLFARLADLYLGKKQSIEAVKLCEAGLKHYPSYYAGHLVLGKIHLELKEYTKARRAFVRAKELSPFNALLDKLIASIPDAPDQPARTTDEDYFSAPRTLEQHDASPAAVPEPSLPEPSAEQPANASLFDTLTPEEMNYIQSTGETTGGESASSLSDLGYPAVPQQTFPSFDEYYAQQQPAIDKTQKTSLDGYLNNDAPSPVTPQPELAPEPVTAVDDVVVDATPTVETDAAPVMFETNPEPEQSAEPEMVFSSPEQAQLFAEMTGQAEAAPDSEQQNDIDALAEKLQSVERIVPREETEASVPPQEEQADQSSYDPNIVTPTLAEIYASQEEYGAAIQAYEILMFSQPEKMGEYQKRVEELQQLQMKKDGLL